MRCLVTATSTYYHGDIVEITYRKRGQGLTTAALIDTSCATGLYTHFFYDGKLYNPSLECAAASLQNVVVNVVTARKVGAWVVDLINGTANTDSREEWTLCENVTRAFLRTYFPDDSNLVWHREDHDGR
jgi:hypothetical protein